MMMHIYPEIGLKEIEAYISWSSRKLHVVKDLMIHHQQQVILWSITYIQWIAGVIWYLMDLEKQEINVSHKDWSNQSYPKHTNIDENTRSNKRRHFMANVIAPVPYHCFCLIDQRIATQERQSTIIESTANVLVNDLNLSSQ